MSRLTEAEKKQWDMFRNLKTVLGRHQFSLLNVNETTDGVEISISMSKTGKTLNQIESELNGNNYR